MGLEATGSQGGPGGGTEEGKARGVRLLLDEVAADAALSRVGWERGAGAHPLPVGLRRRDAGVPASSRSGCLGVVQCGD